MYTYPYPTPTQVVPSSLSLRGGTHWTNHSNTWSRWWIYIIQLDLAWGCGGEYVSWWMSLYQYLSNSAYP
jgi:hypothetical protein